MSKELVLLAIHGMGDTQENFADDFQEKLADRLGDSKWDNILFDTIFYQSVLQPHQDRVMKAMRRTEIDWIRLRKFLLFGFSDAAGLERRAASQGSPYEKVQQIIRTALKKAFNFIGESKPVVLVAHSLGGQVISNYIWDAQQNSATRGVWKNPTTQRGTPVDDFLRCKQLKFFYTTGCNIPIFVAGFPELDIRAIDTSTNGYAFRWKNFYDEDDALGWPLKPLSTSYRSAVFRDKEVNVGNVARSWNPLSHNGYWTDSDVLKPLARDIRALLP